VKPPDRPLLIFDGQCDFCRTWIARWQRTIGDRLDCAPYQEVASRFPEIPLERFKRAVQLIEPDGRHSEAAEAVFRSLALAPGHGWLLWLYRHVPGFTSVSEWCYRLVADHRDLFMRLTRWIWGAHVVPPGESLTAWLFLRILGVIYAIAFLSLWTQIFGLAGSQGILPARDFLQGVREHYGPVRFWLLPTLCWANTSDAFLNGLCATGTFLSLLLTLGVAPILSLVGLWALYLSLATVCQDFLWFQWDGLLLETGFFAIFLAPWRSRSRPRGDPAPSRAALWLLRWLLFRLMLSSAAVKLLSGDPNWRHLTALDYHYETQCLPPWTAWYAQHLPAWFQKASVVMMFAIEGLVPFFIIAPRRIRFVAGLALVGLQAIILVTGNYCFFNLLAIALCLLLLDDGVWPRRWREPVAQPSGVPARGLWPNWVTRPAVAVLFLTSLVPIFRALHLPANWLGPIPGLYRVASPWRTVNSYGLFAVMTTRRPEIIVEGSSDGDTWRPYEFRYKPGDVMRRPRFVAPHQPRLDWQMWFAALGDYRGETWFLRFCERLLQGSPPVLAMMAKNPFPDAPPRLIRAVVYDYHFTDPATRRATGAWWRRELRGLYCPILALENGRLVAVSEYRSAP
jgi:predicted DCC family thiol-disulfide oxidoreductase YuxK